MGTSINLEFDHPESIIYIEKNFFHKNQATLAVCMNVLHRTGVAMIRNNIFLENMAFSKTGVDIGSGAAISISGSQKTMVILLNNLYLFNGAENAGIFFFF